MTVPSDSPLLTPHQIADALSIRDLTDPAQGSHALQQVLDLVVRNLAATWGCAVQEERRGPIVPIEDNYERLGYPADAVTRDSRYTRYVSDTCMLRSHCSASIPAALRRLARARVCPADVLLVCPGLVYRRDVIGRYHSGTPHQLDLWRITSAPMGPRDLLAMVECVVAAVVPDREWRVVEASHPYTTDGLQIDVLHEGAWVEVGECGVAAGPVLRDAGLPDTISGLAMGLGLDRLLMIAKRVPDIRLLRSDHPAVARQMQDLSSYRPVSSMPPVRRDMSLAWPADLPADPESLGARVREALEERAGCVESLEVLSTTAWAKVPHVARARIGMGPEHVNVLVRMVLRDLNQTLTDAQANELRDAVYGVLHHGSVTHQTG